MLHINDIQDIEFDSNTIDTDDYMSFWDHVGTFMYAGMVEARAQREAILSDESFIGYEKNPWEEDEIAIFVENALRLMPYMEALQEKADKIMKQINFIEARLNLAKKDRTKRLTREAWNVHIDKKRQLWDRFKEVINSKKKLNNELRSSTPNMTAAWTAWYNKFEEDLEQAEKWFKEEYLNIAVNDNSRSDTRSIDDQEFLTASFEQTLNCLAETHMTEEKEYYRYIDIEQFNLPKTWFNHEHVELDRLEAEMINLGVL